VTPLANGFRFSANEDDIRTSFMVSGALRSGEAQCLWYWRLQTILILAF
jgi:hypothetical protein